MNGKYVLDTTAIIKGLIEPRRKKQDEILKEQIRIHKIVSKFMDMIYSKEIELLIPTIAIIETAAVAARLTGNSKKGKETARFLMEQANQILNEEEILNDCIDIASTTMKSGFDATFITCAKLTNSELITDDKKMHDAAIKLGIKAQLLREIKIS